MKVAEAIEKIKGTKPNPFGDDVLVEDLNQLEKQVQVDVMRRATADIVTYSWATDSDTEMLIPGAFESCYLFYLAAMIDYRQQEIISYQQNMLMFNTLWDEYKKWYKRSEEGTTLRVKNYW